MKRRVHVVGPGPPFVNRRIGTDHVVVCEQMGVAELLDALGVCTRGGHRTEFSWGKTSRRARRLRYQRPRLITCTIVNVEQRSYPDLKFAFSEGGIGWIPLYLDRSDRHYTNQKWLRRDFGDKTAQ